MTSPTETSISAPVAGRPRGETPSLTALVALVVLHIVVALPLAYHLNVWADEASTLFTTQHGLANSIETAADVERQAPLYFWLLSLWRLIDSSIFLARLFSIICAAAAIVCFSRLAGQFLTKRAALFATAFFAMHPYLIWASVEIRVYSLVILMSVVLIFCFARGFWHTDTVPLRRLAAFAAAATLSLYINYYLGFILVGLFASLLVGRRFAAARSYLFAMLAAAIAVIPLIIVVSRQFVVNTGGYQAETPFIEGVRLIWHHVVTFLIPGEVFNDEATTLVDIVRLWLVRFLFLVIATVAFVSRRRLTDSNIVTVTTASVTAAFLLTAYFLLGSDYVELRHAAVLFVPFVLAVAVLISDILPVRPAALRILAASGILIVAGSFALGLHSLYPQLAKKGDWAKVGKFIAAHENSSQPIVVFPVYDALAMSYHRQATGTVLPASRHFDFQRRQAEFGSPLSKESEIDFVTSQFPPDAGAVWLATGEICQTTRACEPLENYIGANYTVLLDKAFYKERLRLLKKK